MTIEEELDLEAIAAEYGAPDPIAPADPEPEPAPTPAAVPDFTEQLAQLEQRFSERESQYKEQISAANTRVAQLEQLVNTQYQRTHAAPPKQEVPKFTREELLEDPIGTLERVSDAKARAAIMANNEQLSGVIGGLIERSWRGELSAISGKKYYPFVKDEIEKMVNDNPQLKLQPNSAELAYNMIVGRDIEKLEKLVKPADGESPPVPAPTRTVPTPRPTGTPAPVPPEDGGGQPKARELTAAEKRLQQKFEKLGFALDAKDFAAGGE